MTACARISGLLAGSVLLILGAAGAGAEGAGPLVYDVTVAGLQCCHNVDVQPMTPAKVTRHIDGDTFDVVIGDPPHGMRTEETIRLMGIDTPEMDEPEGTKALDHVVRTVGAGPVYLAFDFRRRDRYDRLLAFVYLPDGTLLNAELIEECLAELYRYDDLMYFYEAFEDLERSAACIPDGDGVTIAAIRNRGRHEHVELQNPTSARVDISGWRICDDDGTVIMIPSGTSLAPGEVLAVCSGAGCVGTPERSVQGPNGNVWGNPGDVGCLKDRFGNLVDTNAYGNQAGDTCPF